jgi:acyl-CoA thioesterase I
MNHFVRRSGLVYPFAAALATAACQGRAVSPPISGPSGVPANVQRVIVLGDSLAVYPSRDRSFPAVLQDRLSEREWPWTVTNAGVNGNTTADGLRRLDEVLRGDVAVLVLALGANDGLRGIDISTIESNLSAIITRAQARGVKVLLCGMETPPIRGWAYTLAFHRLFVGLAAEHGVALVPFLLAGVALNPDLNGPDGIHPNAAGARRIADTVWPYLEPLLATVSTK